MKISIPIRAAALLSCAALLPSPALAAKSLCSVQEDNCFARCNLRGEPASCFDGCIEEYRQCRRLPPRRHE
jgi:hypothetical protein